MGSLRGTWTVAAVAVLVALLAGGVAVLAAGQGSSPDGPSNDGSSDGRWHPDLPYGIRPADVPSAVPMVSQEVSFPAAEAAGVFAPAPSESAGKPPCGADDVSLGLERGDGPGQVRFRLEAARAGVACVVSRYPHHEYSRDGEAVEVLSRTPDPREGDWPAQVLVTTRRAAVLSTAWRGWCAAPPFDTLVMFFDDNSSSRLDIEGQVTGCTGDALGRLPRRMLMTGWEPEGWTLDPPDDFTGLRGRLVDTVPGPGGLPTWVVQLTATGADIDLDACPSWEVRQGRERAVSWRLNCAGVPHRRADGTPYLPAGEPVRFAVWAPYGDSDATLTWVLTTADGSVSVPLSEGPPAPGGGPRLVPGEAANLHLYVSNQSFADPDVAISVSVDGVLLVDEDFAVGSQHTFVGFDIALPPGRHEVVVTSDTNARLTRSVRIPPYGDRWAAVLFWKETSRDDTGWFDWRLQRSPIGFA